MEIQLNPFCCKRNFARFVTLCREEHIAQCNTKCNRKTIALKRFLRTFAADREALAISGPITRSALAILSAATGARCLRLFS